MIAIQGIEKLDIRAAESGIDLTGRKLSDSRVKR